MNSEAEETDGLVPISGAWLRMVEDGSLDLSASSMNPVRRLNVLRRFM